VVSCPLFLAQKCSFFFARKQYASHKSSYWSNWAWFKCSDVIGSNAWGFYFIWSPSCPNKSLHHGTCLFSLVQTSHCNGAMVSIGYTELCCDKENCMHTIWCETPINQMWLLFVWMYQMKSCLCHWGGWMQIRYWPSASIHPMLQRWSWIQIARCWFSLELWR